MNIPFEIGVVAEAIGEGCGGDAVEGKKVIVVELRFVFGKVQLLNKPVEGHIGRFDLGGVFGLAFVGYAEGDEADERFVGDVELDEMVERGVIASNKAMGFRE